MTEKRFWYDGAKIVDFKKDKEYPVETIGDFRGIEELLSSLNDENEQLEKRLQIYKIDGLETLNDLQRARDNNKKASKNIEKITEENEQLKVRFKEERELAMRLSRECDTLTITKQELELEIERLEAIIKTGKR